MPIHQGALYIAGAVAPVALREFYRIAAGKYPGQKISALETTKALATLDKIDEYRRQLEWLRHLEKESPELLKKADKKALDPKKGIPALLESYYKEFPGLSEDYEKNIGPIYDALRATNKKEIDEIMSTPEAKKLESEGSPTEEIIERLLGGSGNEARFGKQDGTQSLQGLGQGGYNRFTPEQQEAINKILSSGQSRLAQEDKYGFGDIAKQAREGFQQETIPAIAERFTAMGSSPMRSGGFKSFTTQAARGLEKDLAALGAQYQQREKGLTNQLLGLGITPSYSGPLIQQGVPAQQGSTGDKFLSWLTRPENLEKAGSWVSDKWKNWTQSPEKFMAEHPMYTYDPNKGPLYQ